MTQEGPIFLSAYTEGKGKLQEILIRRFGSGHGITTEWIIGEIEGQPQEWKSTLTVTVPSLGREYIFFSPVHLRFRKKEAEGYTALMAYNLFRTGRHTDPPSIPLLPGMSDISMPNANRL